MKKQKIGMTINLSGIKNIWANGMFQNIYTLYFLLKNTNLYEPYILVSMSSCKNEKEIFENTKKKVKLNIISTHDLYEGKIQLDLIIEAGVLISSEMLKKIKGKNKNTKIVALNFGNVFFTAANGLLSGRDFFNYGEIKRDEEWHSPHYDFQSSFLKSVFNAKSTKTAPYIWSHEFVKSSVMNFNKRINRNYKEIAVMEPTVNVTKTPIIPLAIVEDLYKVSPELVSSCKIINGKKLASNPSFADVINFTSSVKNKITTFEDRKIFCDIFTNDAGLLLSHQHFNELNYVYLEALYFGIPLVHNSPPFKDVGYYYDGFDVAAGAKALQDAIENHDKNLEDYREKAKDYIWKYSPDNPENIQGYIDLIEGVLGPAEKESSKAKRDHRYSVIMMSYLEDYESAAKFREQKFIRAVNSFISQTYCNKELVIVSDGCKKTNQLYELLYRDNEEIILVKKKKKAKNKYPGSLRQEGIDASSGDRIMYLDSDDYYHPQRIEKINEQFTDDLDWVCGPSSYPTKRKDNPKKIDNQFINEVNENLRYKIDDYVWLKAGFSLEKKGFGTPSIIHKKSIKTKWSNFTESKPEDHRFVEDLLEENLKFKEIDNSTYYICHLTSTNTKTGKRTTVYDV